MSVTVFNPTITQAGQAAAINADFTGVDLAITHVAFGTGAYNPTGNETALANEVKRVTITAGALVTPTQARITAIWESATDNYGIGEIGFYAGAVLFAVWSRLSGGPIGYKTPGVDFVLFNDLKFTGIPPGSITIQVDESGASAALAAIASHEVASDPHPQYVRKATFPDAHENLLCAATGTGNVINLAPAIGVTVAAYKAGQEFSFKATAKNTGPVTVNVDGLGPVAVKKHGAKALSSGDIPLNAMVKIVNDGTDFFLVGGEPTASGKSIAFAIALG